MCMAVSISISLNMAPLSTPNRLEPRMPPPLNIPLPSPLSQLVLMRVQRNILPVQIIWVSTTLRIKDRSILCNHRQCRQCSLAKVNFDYDHWNSLPFRLSKDLKLHWIKSMQPPRVQTMQPCQGIYRAWKILLLLKLGNLFQKLSVCSFHSVFHFLHLNEIV